MRASCILLSVLVLNSWLGASAHGADAIELFEKQIRPALHKYCYECHSAASTKRKGGLSLDFRDGVLKGGATGPAVVPGDPEKSLLIQAIRYGDADTQMPPKDKLPADLIAAFEQWVKGGAPDSRDKSDAKITDPAEVAARQWAFRPVQVPAPPVVSNPAWPRNEIDSFILAKLEEQKLAPSSPADKRTLLRRVTFDLIGLPPSDTELAAFVADNAPDAFSKVVERLLASPHYGERWGRHWLDVIRFAESHGFEMNNPRPNAWVFRDYVIDAFNKDKPYDKFVIEQLAGDSVGVPEATGYVVGGQWDQVKSPDPGLTAQQRADELHDMVSTTASTFLGLTVGCARCHDHKFDPISQVDYYAMTANFAGVKHGERQLRLPEAPAREMEAAELRKQLDKVESELRAFEFRARVGGGSDQPLRVPVSAALSVDSFAPVEAKFLRFTVLSTSDNTEPCIDELEVISSGDDKRNVALASAGTKATASSVYPGAAIHKLEHINEGKYGNSHSWISNERGAGWVQLEFAAAQSISKVVWARDRELKYADRLATRYKIEVSHDGTLWTTVANSEDRQAYSGAKTVPAPYSAAGMGPEKEKQLAELLRSQAELKTRTGKIVLTKPAYVGNFVNAEPTFLLNRGDPLQKKQQVAPGGLAAISPELKMDEKTPEQQRRLALAKWITDPKNPLAARVMVNRIWHYHFGSGIVNTPSDFGANGARSSHPELLDWLAQEFVQRGWSVKAMHRLILNSATYQQSSRLRKEAFAVDASTRLLWRFPARRLEAEPIRDSILWVSGKLNLASGGPGYDVFEPNSNYVRIYTPKQQFGPAEFRRMVYQFKPRMQQDGTFGCFDCPDGGQIAPRRTSSTTPLQALNMLNSNFMLQQANFLAERLKKEAGDNAEAQVRRAFMLAFTREPDGNELKSSMTIIQSDGLVIFCRALLNANEFYYVY
jgi:hypothetical protein